MNNIWETLNIEQKNKFAKDYHQICAEYKEAQNNCNMVGTALKLESKKLYLEEAFGKENLESFVIVKTWDDLEHAPYDFSVDIAMDRLNVECVKSDKDILRKLQATIQIAKLIEYGYGGRLTYEELCDHNTFKYSIVPEENDILSYKIIEGHWFPDSLIVFKTRRDAMSFKLNDANKELLDNYYNS